MPFAPCEEWYVQIAESEKKERRCYAEGQNVGRINSCKASPPEFSGVETFASIGVDENEARQDEKEVHADVANSGKILVPPWPTGKHSFHLEVEQDYMKSGQET